MTLIPRRRSPLLYASMLGLGSLVGLAQCSAASSDAGAVKVSASDDLQAAIARSHDGVIRLAPGQHAALVILNYTGTQPLVIESARVDTPAIVAGLTIRGSHNITIRNLIVRPPQMSVAEAAVKGAEAQSASTVRNSRAITIDAVSFEGAPIPGAMGTGTGLMLRGTVGSRIVGCRFSHFRYGLAFLSGEAMQIERNEFHSLRTDAIRGGGVSNLTIAGNVVSDLKPDPGDHPDGVQLWTANETKPARSIRIRDNLILRGRGGIIQGIFVRDNKLQLPFEDMEISGNLVVGSMYNGIAVQGARRVSITGNEVIAEGGQKSWIRLNHGEDSVIADNRAPLYVIKDNSGVDQQRNRIVAPGQAETRKRVREWLAARPAMTASAGPLLRQIIADQAETSPRR